jgi:tryptophan-rich sensory protein
MRKITWTLGAVAFTVAYCLLALQVPYQNSSVPLQWLLFLISTVVACLVMFSAYLIFERGKEKTRARRRHPTYRLD